MTPPTSKQSQLIALLGPGASMAQMMKLTGWQPHTVRDETGRKLIPSHTRKGKKRYRYDVTPAEDPGHPIRLPAAELENLVIQAIADWTASDKQVLDAVGWKDAVRAQGPSKRSSGCIWPYSSYPR